MKKRYDRKAFILIAVAAVLIVGAYFVTTEIRSSVKYRNAMELMESGRYGEALAAFRTLGTYKDSEERIVSYETAAMNHAQVGETVFFGACEQDNQQDNGKEAIEWLVLDIEDGKALLISKYALDCKPYNTIDRTVTWETCTLRTWLNTSFYNEAFLTAEQAKIPTVTVSADENPSYATAPGNPTQDKVFLLNIAEVQQYFMSDSARQCTPTDYAMAEGAYVINGTNGNCWWWLRSPGNFNNIAAYVGDAGDVRGYGYYVDYGSCAVRPALWVTLE